MSADNNSLRASVTVRDAQKTYGKGKNANHVLRGLNMTVYAGKIYALLGSSGCGKTTLLSCIVGRKQLDAGTLGVLGRVGGVGGNLVGYVPQELALWPEFTIRETMIYFGFLYGMSRQQIDIRLNALMIFLDLPDKHRKIRHLSGGQQRRVSLAVGFLHDPELLILDEPTVGVDPILRKSIWDYMINLSNKKGKAIIITTHYIEEARRAHRVGMMRDGKLLMEDSPDNLLQRFDSDSLAGVFLQLSHQQEENAIEYTSSTAAEEHVETVAVVKEKPTGGSKIAALLFKNFLSLWRSTAMILFIFLLPVLQVIFFCTAIGHDPQGLHVAVFNAEINHQIDDCYVLPGCQMDRLSCRYLSHLRGEEFPMRFHTDLEGALAAVRNGDAWAAIHFRRNFSESISHRIKNRLVNDAILETSEIKVYPDFSNYQIGLSLQYNMQKSYVVFLRDLAKDCNINPHRAESPLSFRSAIVGSENPTFMNFMASGTILTIVFFLEVGLTSLTLISERTQGLLDRSWIAGVTPTQLILSHTITHCLIIIIQTALVILFMMFLFDVEFRGWMGLICALTFLQGVCGMSYGLFISTICRMERDAIQLAVGSFYPNLLLSGVVWPVEGISWILRPVAVFLPLTLATDAMRNVMSRGWDWTRAGVYLGFVSTTVWIFTFFTFSVIVIKNKQFK